MKQTLQEIVLESELVEQEIFNLLMETDDLPEELERKEKEIFERLAKKTDNCVLAINAMKAKIAALEVDLTPKMKKKKSIENKLERLTDYLKYLLEMKGSDLNGEIFKLRLAKNPKPSWNVDAFKKREIFYTDDSDIIAFLEGKGIKTITTNYFDLLKIKDLLEEDGELRTDLGKLVISRKTGNNLRVS